MVRSSVMNSNLMNSNFRKRKGIMDASATARAKNFDFWFIFGSKMYGKVALFPKKLTKNTQSRPPPLSSPAAREGWGRESLARCGNILCYYKVLYLRQL